MTTDIQNTPAGEPARPRLALHKAAIVGQVAAPANDPSKTAARASLITLVTGLVLGALLIIAGQGLTAPATTTRGAPRLDVTSAPTIAPTIEATPAATAQPALAPGLAVYFAPDGASAPSVASSTTSYTATARYAGWVQIEIEGYAVPVWARADALQGIDLAALPEPYEPTPTPEPVVIVRQAPAAPAAPVVLDCTPERIRYRVSLAVGNLGTVEGVSCSSQGQAQANAEALAEQLRAQAGR